METVYRQRANGTWEYWFYADGRTYWVTEAAAQRMIREGARLVTA